MQAWNLKQQLFEAINQNGGFVNCHAHFDKAFIITKEGLDKSMVDMETKWHMSDDIKKNSSQDDIKQRISHGLDILIEQGIKRTVSFIDAYDAVQHRAIDAAVEAKQEYQDKIEFLTISQPLGGLIDQATRSLYEEITTKADIAGGLPSVDRPNDSQHYDNLFAIAKNLNKPVHVHIDQENNPKERDCEQLIEATIKHGYQGRVVAVHAISVSAQPKQYRQKIYQGFSDAGISLVVCPSAALSMRQLDNKTSPVHNSIANVPELLEAGVTVGLGVDNINDFYMPFVDGDMWIELRMLMEACRFYNFDELLKICTSNGNKILDIR